MSLSEIVTTSIQAGTVSPARAGFGIPLFMGYHTAWTGSEVRSYTSFSGVAADFGSTTLPYLWAAAVFSQNPRPSKIKIGRLPAPGTGHTVVLDFADMATGTNIAINVVEPDGTSNDLAITWTTDLATTLALLETAIEALGDLTATVVGSVVTVVGTGTLGRMWHWSPETTGVHVRDTTADWDIDDALTAAAVIDGDFYVVCCDNNSPKNMDKVARWALANDRLAAFAPQYTKPAQFVTGEFSAGADYTAFLANDAAVFDVTASPRTTFLEGGIFGRMLPLDPGSATYAYKSIEGVGADAWTSSQRSAIEAYHGNHYTTVAGVDVFRPGKTAGGEWIDVVIGLAWLEARLQEGLFAALVSNPKIPYTDAGLAILVGVVRGVLKTAEDRSILDAGWTVTITAVADQETADRAARIVRGLEFSARLAGAVHQINLVGTVTA